jgi:hypothetical protein
MFLTFNVIDKAANRRKEGTMLSRAEVNGFTSNGENGFLSVFISMLTPYSIKKVIMIIWFTARTC